MNMRTALIGLFIAVMAIFIGWYFLNKAEDKPIRLLPYFGPKAALKVNDTVYHSIGNFSFTDQNGQTVTSETVKGKIYVTDYFFTTCQSICPIMNTQLTRVYKTFKNQKDFMILSHTVDPETDTVAQLAMHAQKYGVDNDQWRFLTGSKKDLYELARKSYLLNAEEGDGGEEDFIHTQNFALIDKDKHIRGFYDGTDSADVSRMIMDIQTLIKEYDYKEKHNH